MSFIKWYTEDITLLPERATKNSVGYDFKSPINIYLEPKDTVLIDSLVACEFSDDLWLGIYGRSSFVNKGIINPLGVGVIDSDYFATGNTIKIAIHNISDQDMIINEGDAIAQGIFHSVNISDDIVTTERTGGFGSTDVKNNYPLFVEIGGIQYNGKYARLDVFDVEGIVIYDEDDLLFISKEIRPPFHSAINFFGKDYTELDGHCWYVNEDGVKDCSKEEASSDFIESLLVKE